MAYLFVDAKLKPLTNILNTNHTHTVKINLALNHKIFSP